MCASSFVVKENGIRNLKKIMKVSLQSFKTILAELLNNV